MDVMPADEKKTKVIEMPASLAEQLETAAWRERQSQAEWMRTAIMEKLNRDKQDQAPAA